MTDRRGIKPISSADDLRIEGITDEEADAFMEAMETPEARATLDPWAPAPYDATDSTPPVSGEPTSIRCDCGHGLHWCLTIEQEGWDYRPGRFGVLRFGPFTFYANTADAGLIGFAVTLGAVEIGWSAAGGDR